jgi:hypothetical protein
VNEANTAQPGLFDAPVADHFPAANHADDTRSSVLDELRTIRIETLSPMDAFDLLRRWHHDVTRGG